MPKFSRREAFAEAVTRDNPLLARAMVNRIWGMLFGQGLVHPVDLMDSKHPPSHPELLAWLARDFERNGYDLKYLVRMLCNTAAYQLDSRARPSAKGKVPPANSFARALDKALSAEQLFDSLLVATENRPDAQAKIAGRSKSELRQAFIAQFPDLFSAEYNATLSQAMFLANSPLVDPLLAPSASAPSSAATSARLNLSLTHDRVRSADASSARIGPPSQHADEASALLAADHAGNLTARLLALQENKLRIYAAFAAIYGREPDRDELRECAGYLSARTPEAGVKQLLWAMLSSAEFQLNH